MQQPTNFNTFITAFEKKLDHVATSDSSLAPHCTIYLRHLLKHKKYYLFIYADVLNKLIQHAGKDKADMCLIDYGAGNGLLGMFAKFCGFKKVFLNDIDAGFVQASANLARQLKIDIDGFITGDSQALQQYFKNEIPDAIVGTDVIEHIYNLEIFFQGLQTLNPAIASVFTTASNPANYFKVRQLKKYQVKDELIGGTEADFILSGKAPMAPFLETREQLIKNFDPAFSANEARALAKATQGMIKADIIAAVKQHRSNGALPDPRPLGTNTCDPLSGSWTERIVSIPQYAALYKAAGFKLSIYNGFYNVFETGFKKYLKVISNTGIAVFGKWLAPYIILVGFPGNNHSV